MSDDEGQPVVDASAERVLPELAAGARDQRPGLLKVDAWPAPDLSPPDGRGRP